MGMYTVWVVHDCEKQSASDMGRDIT